MQFVQAPCYATMDKLSDFNDIFNRRKNVFHLSEFSAKSENPNPNVHLHSWIFFGFSICSPLFENEKYNVGSVIPI